MIVEGDGVVFPPAQCQVQVETDKSGCVCSDRLHMTVLLGVDVQRFLLELHGYVVLRVHKDEYEGELQGD